MSYKWCVVPQCTNTSNKTPEKMFVSIPKNTKNRKKWIELARRNPKDISARTNAFMCEDHFNGYTIIANVYHYQKREYELMKSQLGGRCDLSPLANIFKRTAAATGVTQRAVAHALDTHELKTSIQSDHSYNLGNTRTNTAHSKSMKADSRANMRRKDRTQSYKRRTNKQQADGRDAEGVSPPKRRMATTSLKSKPTNEKQLPQDEESDGEGTPSKRRTSRNSVSSKPTNEDQLPFPSPIQLREPEVMETQFKAEPADDECQQTHEHDPFGSVSRSPIHCRTPETTETVFKADPPDDECPQKPEVDPLETESSPAALEEPSDPSDVSEVVVKFERVDEEYADLCTDYSICDPVLLDMKPEPPFE